MFSYFKSHTYNHLVIGDPIQGLYQSHIKVIGSILLLLILFCVCVCVYSIPLSRIYNSANKLPTTSYSVLRPSGRQQGEIKLSMTFVPKVGFFHPQIFLLFFKSTTLWSIYLGIHDCIKLHCNFWPVPIIILKNT